MIDVENLAIRFSRDLPFVFQDINYQLRPGTGLQIAGPNGSGKTTFLRVFAGLILPEQGRILLGKKSLFSMRSQIAYCSSQLAGFHPRLSVREGFYDYASLYGLSTRTVNQYIASQSIFEFDLWDSKFEQLSSGQKHKAQLIRTFLTKPNVVLLDEPLNFLDQQSNQLFTAYLKKWLDYDEHYLLVAQHGQKLYENTLDFSAKKQMDL